MTAINKLLRVCVCVCLCVGGGGGGGGGCSFYGNSRNTKMWYHVNGQNSKFQKDRQKSRENIYLTDTVQKCATIMVMF